MIVINKRKIYEIAQRHIIVRRNEYIQQTYIFFPINFKYFLHLTTYKAQLKLDHQVSVSMSEYGTYIISNGNIKQLQISTKKWHGLSKESSLVGENIRIH